jgi:hypothetical protein
MNQKLPAPKVIVESREAPEARIDYEKFLVEYRQSGCLAKSARAVGISRRAVYWRAKHDPAFKAQLERIKSELKAVPMPSEVLVPASASHSVPDSDWRAKFEEGIRNHGLIPIASIQAGVESEEVERLLESDQKYAQRVSRLCEEANSRMLFFARERAMSGRADQLLLAWLKAYNEAFREKTSIKVQAITKNAHLHFDLNKETLEKLRKEWEEQFKN